MKDLTSLARFYGAELEISDSTTANEINAFFNKTISEQNGVALFNFGARTDNNLNLSDIKSAFSSVSTSITNITFRTVDKNGNAVYKLFTEFNIVVGIRTTPLNMYFENFSFKAPSGAIGLNNPSTNTNSTLTIYYKGDNSIKGGKGIDGTEGAQGTTGSQRSGTGSKGKDGNQKTFWWWQDTDGQQGGTGGEGNIGGTGKVGGNGSNGGDAISSYIAPIFIKDSISNTGTLQLQGGDGGDGGKGGKGGNGGKGQAGGEGGWAGYYDSVNGTGPGNPGKGGTGGIGGTGGQGGNGGRGGDGGYAISHTVGTIDKTGLDILPSTGGKGGGVGLRGDGGSGGDGGIGGFKVKVWKTNWGFVVHAEWGTTGRGETGSEGGTGSPGQPGQLQGSQGLPREIK